MFCRENEAVIVSPSCSLLKLRSAILEIGLLDSSLYLSERSPPMQGVRQTSRAGQGSASAASGGSGGTGTNTPTAGSPGGTPPPQGDQQVLAVCAEKGVSVFAMPSQRLTGSVMMSEGVTVVRAAIVSWGGAKMSPLFLLFTSEGVVKGW